MTRLLLVGGAGAAGSMLRYLVGRWAVARFGVGFPVGTLLVNLVGCFLIAFVTHLALATTRISEDARIILTTGFLGGFTTYSAFNHETTALALDGALGRAALNLAVTVVGGLVTGLLGVAVARLVAGR